MLCWPNTSDSECFFQDLAGVLLCGYLHACHANVLSACDSSETWELTIIVCWSGNEALGVHFVRDGPRERVGWYVHPFDANVGSHHLVPRRIRRALDSGTQFCLICRKPGLYGSPTMQHFRMREGSRHNFSSQLDSGKMHSALLILA